MSPPKVSPSPSSTKHKDGDAFILLNDRRLSSESYSTQQDIGPMVWSMGRQPTAIPGRAERLKSEASVESESSSSRPIEDRLKSQSEDNTKQVKQLQKSLSIEECQQLDEECLQRFLKVNVRLMTEDHVSLVFVFFSCFRKKNDIKEIGYPVKIIHVIVIGMNLIISRLYFNA